jgi:uncharacterized protein (TIGR02284 family)
MWEFRGRDEVTMPNESAQPLIATLNNLIVLDFDAVSAYQAAIERLEGGLYKRTLRKFLGDHERHIEELSPLVHELGGRAPVRSDVRTLLTLGKLIVGQLAGDRGILSALDGNEDDTNEAYAAACRRLDAPAHVQTVLLRSLADERRHRAWLERALGQKRPVMAISTEVYAV